MKAAQTQRFDENRSGRDFVVGDVHGHFPTLKRLLEEVSFDARVDRLFSVGGLVHRGPQFAQALECIKSRLSTTVHGNDKRSTARYIGDPAGYGPLGPHEPWMEHIPAEDHRAWADALEALPIAVTVETALGPVGIVHADAPTRK